MTDRDFVVLPRDALLELFGELALPPWIDSDGTVIGGSIDCAPIAERITSWIAEHDLSDVHIGSPTPTEPGVRDSDAGYSTCIATEEP